MASLYLHIPFCEHKCIYCDFYSIEALDPMESFLVALRDEIGMYAHHQSSFETIFFGGGTPSLLSPATIRELIGLLKATFDVEKNAEITLETNPGTVDERKLEGYREAGVNRVSFGVQSFHDDDLKFLTRIHSSSQARDVIRLAERAGFDNTNLDLIFALPGQTMERWRHNLEEAVALRTKHISAYSLIVEKNTPLHRMVNAGEVSTLPLGLEAEMYAMTMEFLAAKGFGHYEVSNYAQPGYHSRHNCNYWNHSNYLGFGPSAHSYWEGKRWWNFSNIRGYAEKIALREYPVAEVEVLTKDQLFDEAVMLGLRSGGVDLTRLKEEFGVDLPEMSGPVMIGLVEEGLAVVEPRSFRLTDKGFLLCDEITQRLLSGQRLPA
jgi:oxygen-independent coproporphyrinogen-3 oxidase